MIKHLTQESFDKLWKKISVLYPTQSAIKTFMVKAAFAMQKVELLGTGEDMVYSLLSFAEKEERVNDIVKTALDANEFPDDPVLKEIQAALNDHSAWLPEISAVDLAAPAAGDPVNVMLIYDRKDNQIVSDLGDQLFPLEEYLKIIRVFDMHNDPEVSGGADAKEVIDRKLKETQIVLLLLTPNFFGKGNDYVKLGINAMGLKKRVIPVLLEPCMWDRISMLENIVPLPRNKQFVSRWGNKDEALLEIATGVDQVAKAIKIKNP
jgi:hypothetical protein